MESLFSFDDYRKFLGQRIAALPKQGYGVSQKLSKAIRVHPSFVSQMLAGTKHLTQDQALATAQFFGFTELETDFLLLLVQLDRAATPSLRELLQRKLLRLREQSRNLADRVNARAVLTEEARGVFYSHWKYSALRQLSAIPGLGNAEAMAEQLALPLGEVREAVRFLVVNGLCVESPEGISVGAQSTHVPKSSPWARMHHRNWRDLGQRAMEKERERDLFFTAPLTLGRKDAERVRELILQFVEQVNTVVDPSPSEELRCLNVEWFGL